MGVRLATHDGYGLTGAALRGNLHTDTNAPEPVTRSGWRGRSHRGLLLRGVLVAMLAGLLSAGLVSPALAADTCDNAAVRVQDSATGLPDCRAYELVSAPFKEGFDVDVAGLGFTDAGLVSYRSIGSFAGNGQGTIFNPYHATRSSTGWAATALSPPGVLYDTESNPANESDDLRLTLWPMSRRNVPGDKRGFWLRGLDGVFTRVGDAIDEFGAQSAVGASNDFSHVVFYHSPQGGFLSDLYEYVGTGNVGPGRAVNVNNLGEHTLSNSCTNDVSADGRVIVFTAGCGGGVPALWARVAGSASVLASGSECTRNASDAGGTCDALSSPTYEGAADDGSRVFFTTEQQLVNGDTDSGNDLYSCAIPPGTPAPVGVTNPCAPLTEVSGSGPDAKVEDVVAISKDGSRVYFVAQGVLADNLGVGGVGPVTAADLPPQAVPHNLYVWERDGAQTAGQTRFVARLDDNSFGDNDVSGGQMTPDGRYLLFLTASKLVTSGPGADGDFATDAYRYDAVNKSMMRVSTSVSGDGGDGSSPVSFGQDAPMMTADGSEVIFDTAEGLSPVDTNGIGDVYSWRDGQVSLISRGGGRSMGIGASGRDIFFTTNTQVLPVDSNANKDIYDARIGGGFPVEQPVSCSGDACRGQRSLPPGLAGPSAVVPGGGQVEAAPVLSLRAVSAAQRKRLAMTGKVTLTVTANAPGTVSVKATSTMGGRSVTVGSTRRSLNAPGRAAVTLTLSKRARNQLAARGRLTVKVDVSHSKVALDRSVTLKLTKAKAKRASAGRRVVGVAGGRS